MGRTGECRKTGVFAGSFLYSVFSWRKRYVTMKVEKYSCIYFINQKNTGENR